MSVSKLDYATLDEQLQAAGATISVAELHGGLSGMFCAAGREAAGTWLAEQIELLQGEAREVSLAAAAAEALESVTWVSLGSTGMDFMPLLPDDDAALGDRVAALGQWCVGFIGGLALGGWRESESEDEVAEIVQDFIEISKAGLGSEDQANEDRAEFSYLELVEYVRVSVLVVFETLVHAATTAVPSRLH